MNQELKRSTSIVEFSVGPILKTLAQVLYSEDETYIPIKEDLKMTNPEYTFENGNFTIKYDIIANVSKYSTKYYLIEQENQNNLDEIIEDMFFFDHKKSFIRKNKGFIE